MGDQDNIDDQNNDGGKPGMPPVDVNHRFYDQSGQATAILPPQTASPEVQKAPEQTALAAPATPDKKLYDQLYKTQLYTKTYPEFQKQFNNPQSIDKLYQGLNESELYTKPKEDFYSQFFSHLPDKSVSDAHDFLSNYLTSPKANKAINKITEDNYVKNIYQQQASGAQGRDATKLSQPIPLRLPDQAESDRKDFETQMQGNPSLMRPVLAQAKKQNPSDAPKINQAMYVADASKRAHSAATTKYYADQLASGKMDYDINSKQLVKPVGTLDAIFHGLKSHSDAMDDYDFLTSHDAEDKIKFLDDKAKSYDPDKPVYRAKSEVASAMGSNASAMAKMSAGAIASYAAGSAAPELSVPIAAITTMGMMAGTMDFHHVAYRDALEETYRELRQAHPDADPHVILSEAEKQANISGAFAMAQGLIAGEVGSKVGKQADFKPVKLRSGFVKALGDIGKKVGGNLVELTKSAVPDVTAQTAVSGALKGIENVSRGKAAGEGVVENMGANALFMAGLAAIHNASGVLIGNAAKTNLIDGYSKMPPEMIDNTLKNAVDLRVISPETAVQTKQEIESHRAETEGMPDLTSPVTPEAEHLLRHIDETGADPSNLNKKVLEKIGKDNGIESEEGKALSANDIVEKLQNKQKNAKLPKTFKSPIERAKEIVNEDNVKGYSAAPLKEAANSEDPAQFEGMLREIAQQAHDPKSEKLTRETYGKELVDLAIQIHPEHILSEPKVSVVHPFENKEPDIAELKSGKPHITVSTPNIVNVKLKDNAIRVGESAPVHVDEASGNSSQMGEGVPKPGEAPAAQESVNENKNIGEEKPPIEPTQPPSDELPFGKESNIGIAHHLQEVRAADLNIPSPERGEGITIQESLQRGKDLIDEGVNPDEIVKGFNQSGKVSSDDMSVVRQKYNTLAKTTNEAFDKHGEGSAEYKSALKEEREWYNNAVRPMKTEFHKLGMAQQGMTDIDTGSFASVSRAFEKQYGKEPNAEQTKQIKELTQKNKELTQKLSDTDAKLIEATNKALVEKESKSSIAQSGKAIADKIRKNSKLSRPGSFSAATPASLVWDGAVEVVAQTIEKGALLADAIVKGIDLIKQSEWYKGLSDDKKLDAINEFADWHNNQATDSIASKFIDKKGNKFTTEEAKEIWEYAKENYLGKGVSFRDMIESVANDTGLSFEQVSSAITTPKTKSLSDARWKQQFDLRKNQKATERYVSKQGENAAIRAFKNVVNSIREESVFGHGGVFVGTHAGMTLVDLPRAIHTIKSFFNAYKFAYGKTADYEKGMENLKTQKNYVLAQRSGLQNNPDFINNDAEIISSKFGKLSESGKRGFNAIKVLRQTLFDKHFDALSDIEKQDPGAAVSIARLVNNATGATNLKLPNWFKEVTFAGGMEAARWGKLTRNPAEATATAVKAMFNPKDVSIEDRVFAKVWAKRVGAQLGTYVGLMAVNAALQNNLNDGKNPVNWEDPTKSDWMKMKIGNTTFDFTSGMLSTLHFAEETLYHQPFGISKSKDDVVTREGKTTFKYGLGKLSPAYADVGEALLSHDYSGNTLPWSDAKPLHNYNHKMTWIEYATSKLPLPVAEGFTAYYESAHQKGADKTTLDNVLTGLKDGVISGTTGFRAYDTPEKKEKTSGSRPSLPKTYQ